jgi:hypothetical protein
VPRPTSGQEPFAFAHANQLRGLPGPAAAREEALHGMFAVDRRPGQGEVYYGMPGCGLMRVSGDLRRQEIIALPADLAGLNFHSTRLGQLDGQPRLFMPANNDGLVAVLTLDGVTDFVLPRPEVEVYADLGQPFRPTDTALLDGCLYVADGYGSNCISVADLGRRRWSRAFGGSTQDAAEHGRFGTAHGLSQEPRQGHLAIADRPHARLEVCTTEGEFVRSHPLPTGSRPCGIDFTEIHGHPYGVVASLDDPVAGRPAPIYLLDGITYEVVSTIRPKEELGIEQADHIHNAVWHHHADSTRLVCQAWNPGRYFVLELTP